jgi:hypothetical protein
MPGENGVLVVTKASDRDYVSRVSLGGAITIVSLAAILLVGIYWLRRDCGWGCSRKWGAGNKRIFVRGSKTNAAWASHPGRIVIADVLSAVFRQGERSSRQLHS